MCWHFYTERIQWAGVQPHSPEAVLLESSTAIAQWSEQKDPFLLAGHLICPFIPASLGECLGACLKIYHYRGFLYIQQKVIHVLCSLGSIFTYWCMFLFICITLSVPFCGGPWTNTSILLSHTMFFKPRQMAVFLFYIVMIRAGTWNVGWLG